MRWILRTGWGVEEGGGGGECVKERRSTSGVAKLEKALSLFLFFAWWRTMDA